VKQTSRINLKVQISHWREKISIIMKNQIWSRDQQLLCI